MEQITVKEGRDKGRVKKIGPFNGLNIIKGGEQIRVEDGSDGGIIKKIGVHLLYLDQHGNVISFPAVVDHSYTPKPPQRCIFKTIIHRFLGEVVQGKIVLYLLQCSNATNPYRYDDQN
ncbi:hypothetical protein MTR67_041730 [Solanum verrucosum]|uniref:Uncharacterized protein n=1 Tax=Solanum verrucosum TaxID=315347 RepID=A0AAF0UM56_SOLVR|nr:hypothetical protein MTR67_041730 [Solanum verrucosum]